MTVALRHNSAMQPTAAPLPSTTNFRFDEALAAADRLGRLTDKSLSPEHVVPSTWDGKPIATDHPHGATVVVYRLTSSGPEFLLLHRAHEGPDYEGDWAWTPPAGARLPGEEVEACARRELLEEAGLSAQLRPTHHGVPNWVVYCAEVDGKAVVTLHDDEHDRFEWVALPEALTRCRPKRVAEAIEFVARDLGAV